MPQRRQNRSQPKPLQLVLPATSANLGPAFDAAALALDLSLKVRARIATDYSISSRGRDFEICSRLENNLILTTYREVLQAEGRPLVPLALKIVNEIPIGKGFGSSAAARLGGIALAVHFAGLGWTDAHIIAEASRREHHPDNVAACWMGGLAVARVSDRGEACVSSVTPKGEWPLLLAVPRESLATQEARRALPAQYSRADAVSNVQNSMLLLAAFVQGRHDLLPVALEDRLHQPYRASLCPLLPVAQDLAKNPGVSGAVLSGAGPSLLIFLDPRHKAGQTKQRVREFLRGRQLDVELVSAGITLCGARGRSGWRRRLH